MVNMCAKTCSQGGWNACLTLPHCLLGRATQHQEAHGRTDQSLTTGSEISISLAHALIPH
jgi:hypothetical protein